MTAGKGYCPACGTPSGPGARFRSRCGQALPDTAPASPYVAPEAHSWDTVAEADAVRYGLQRGSDRTRTGLLLMILSFALGWIPYVAFVAGILAFIGIIYLWLGRNDLGPGHRRSVMAGCVCVVLAILVSIIAVLGFVSAVFSAAAAAGTTLSDVGATLRGALERLLVSVIVAGALGSLGYVLLPYALADRTSRALLWGGLALSVGLSVLVVAVLWPQLSSAVAQATSGSSINVGPVQAVETRETILATLQFFPQMMFLAAYYRVRNREAKIAEGTDVGPAPSSPYGRLR